MSEIKQYAFTEINRAAGIHAEVVEDRDGDYVLHRDHLARIAQLEAQAQKLREEISEDRLIISRMREENDLVERLRNVIQNQRDSLLKTLKEMPLT